MERIKIILTEKMVWRPTVLMLVAIMLIPLALGGIIGYAIHKPKEPEVTEPISANEQIWVVDPTVVTPTPMPEQKPTPIPEEISTGMSDEALAIIEEKDKRIADLSMRNDVLVDMISVLESHYYAGSEARQDDFADIARLWYVLRDADPECGLDVDVLRYSISQCKVWDVNPDIMWGIYYLESRYYSNRTNEHTYARGLGQVIPSTAEYYWNTVLGHSGYDHEMAYDPYVNIEITTALMSKNLQYGYANAVCYYAGDSSGNYLSQLTAKLAEYGIQITDANCHYN